MIEGHIDDLRCRGRSNVLRRCVERSARPRIPAWKARGAIEESGDHGPADEIVRKVLALLPAPAREPFHARAALLRVLAALVLLVVMIVPLEPLFFVGALAVAYAWIGRYFFEGNRPATFSHALWSFMGDIRMFRL